ncbi:MAG: FHA domain-containing protein [Gammaproteobacteria bacterium]|jgi:predicted component of type VI protein secretion system|nr:FHA domain-containing protein [Gammaproteobacteria bacterium]
MNQQAQYPILLGISATVRDQRIEVTDELLLGNDQGCDICLPGAQVAASHARVSWTDNALQVRRMQDDAELFVNGKSIAVAQLNAGDELRIGNCRFMVKMPALRPPSVLRDQAPASLSARRKWLIATALLVLAAAAAYWYLR